MKKFICKLSCMTTVFCFAASVPAFAEDVPAETAQPSASSSGEITVTARRRVERLIDVPVAASVMSQEAVARYATGSLTQLGTQVPQVRLSQGNATGNTSFEIRGVGALANDAGIEQMVSLNVDGMIVSRGRGVVSTGLFDLASVEVLKGPQTLFFGKNSPGGVISLNSVSPGDVLEGYGRVGFNFLDKQRYVEGAVSVPLGGGLAVRIAARADDSRGYIRNTAVPEASAFYPGYITNPLPKWGPGDNNILGRVTLKYDNGGPFSATLKVFGSRHRDQGAESRMEILRCAPGNTKPTLVSGGVVDTSGDCRGDYRRTSSGPHVGMAPYLRGFDQNFSEIETWISSLVADYEVNDVTVTSTTGFYQFNSQFVGNYGYTNQHFSYGDQTERHRSITQELRATSDFDGPLNFTVGAFYENQDRPYTAYSVITPLAQDTTIPTYPLGSLLSYGSLLENSADTYSAFGQLRWSIRDIFELAGGVRYTRQTNRLEATQLLTPPALAASQPLVGEFMQGSTTFDNWSPEFTATWHPTRDLTIYGAYKTGFISGGYANPPRLPKSLNINAQRYRPSTVKGGEVGAKASLMDGRLSLDATAYLYDYADLQVTAYDAVSIIYSTTNAAESRVKGVEAQARFSVTPELSLRGFAAYNHARFLSFPSAQCYAAQTVAQGCVVNAQGAKVQDRSGERLGITPDFSGSFGFSYDAPLAGDWNFELSSDLTYTSKYNYTAGGGSPYRRETIQDGYASLSATLKFYTPTVEFALIGNNLTNRDSIIFAGDTPYAVPGTLSGVLMRPREVIAQATFRF